MRDFNDRVVKTDDGYSITIFTVVVCLEHFVQLSKSVTLMMAINVLLISIDNTNKLCGLLNAFFVI